MKTIYGAVSVPKMQLGRQIAANRSHLDEWFANLSDTKKLEIFDREVKNEQSRQNPVGSGKKVKST